MLAAEATWQPTVWNGEEAMQSTQNRRRAIVSIERARLVALNLTSSDRNLLFAPDSRNDPAGWGGHRVWLGPQSLWAKIWPPPDAWEHRRPESYSVAGNTLRLVMRDAGAGWPRLVRTYRWEGSRLICGVEVHGGARPAQVIQIIQVPAGDIVHVEAQPDAENPQGYVRLPAGHLAVRLTGFTPPRQVTRQLNHLSIENGEEPEKLGFRPQFLVGAPREGLWITVDRISQTGRIVRDPDLGFPTQVYLGGREPFIELEQLSPLFAMKTDACFEICVDAGEPLPLPTK